MSYHEKIRVREIINDLLSKGIIRESESEFSSPILLVKKKGGSDRMCVDFRALNANTVKDRYPLPLIDDHIDRLGKLKFFTSLDMATGFHQIPMHNDSIRYTGFVTPEGHFEYLKMPYGFANAPVVYQRIISDTLRPFIEAGKATSTTSIVYIDDVLIPSETIDERLQTLREVLRTLTTAGISINLKKCTFLAREVDDGVTPVIRSVVRDIASEATSPNRESLRELARQRASELLEDNRAKQDAYVNERRRVPQPFRIDDLVYVKKTSQSTEKLDSGMRGPYAVTKILPQGRYELRLVSGSYGQKLEKFFTGLQFKQALKKPKGRCYNTE
ncbi:unnamed protein product [Colias eurytheme]|nr:unnamed protein product [Colias eurytheme]